MDLHYNIDILFVVVMLAAK